MAGVSLARFDNGKVILAPHDLQSVSFIAISHVWGDTEYQDLPGFDLWQIPVSRHKMAFILDRLPQMVENSWFWMDIICVDQRNEDAGIAVVDHIPDIFRRAAKTLVIRDGDGLMSCCRNTIGTFDLDQRWHQTLYDHLRSKHLAELLSDSWLERLWPLQEAILSNNLQFASCADRDISTFRFYGENLTLRRMQDDLWTVSHAWVSYGREKEDVSGPFEDDALKFMNAFLHNGTVTRPNLPEATFGSRGFGWELRQHSNSRRKTAKPRDFILAIMPPVWMVRETSRH